MVRSVSNLFAMNGIFASDCQLFSVMFLSFIEVFKTEVIHKLSFWFCGYLNLRALKRQYTS